MDLGKKLSRSIIFIRGGKMRKTIFILCFTILVFFIIGCSKQKSSEKTSEGLEFQLYDARDEEGVTNTYAELIGIG